jgi:hypothetical protein
MQYYVMAANNVRIVGRRLSEMIVFLIRSGMVSGPEKVHLIGYSLGAHVAGIAGYEVLQNISVPIQRITGLDPAGCLLLLCFDPRILYKQSIHIASKP